MDGWSRVVKYYASGSLVFGVDSSAKILQALGLVPTPSNRTQMDLSSRIQRLPLTMAQLIERRAAQTAIRRITIPHVLYV
jgi:hypothetical protein